MSELNTTMSTAFRLAGFETPRQKLRQMMREAIEAHAIRVPSCAAFKAALSDAEEAPLLAALCADIIDDLVDDLYDGVLAEMRDRGIKPEVTTLKQPQKFTETGYSRNGSVAAPNASRGGQCCGARNGHGQSAAVRRATPTRPNYSAVTESTARCVYFDTTMINGVPLRKAEVRETREWLRSHQRQGTFVELMIANLPDFGTVGDHRSDADAEKCYRLALEAADAATA